MQSAASTSEPRERHTRDPIRRGRTVLKPLPLRRDRQHRIDRVAHHVKISSVDQARAPLRIRRKTTLANPATNRARSSTDSLCRLCDREHQSILRVSRWRRPSGPPRPDDVADRGPGKWQPCHYRPESPANRGYPPRRRSARPMPRSPHSNAVFAPQPPSRPTPPEREVASSNLAGRTAGMPANELVCSAGSLAGAGVLGLGAPNGGLLTLLRSPACGAERQGAHIQTCGILRAGGPVRCPSYE
jgi:hypothetical protein